ncbi:MAG: NAD-dependent epimerase/dehydratase family protein [Candidatus Kapabacteria bacterium]|nr:NAD-dependent epimerase/dehydratase family protein [Candidatus Kapabacteria bacterium]
MKNILITGGAGFIGSKLALSLINKGYSVTVLDCLSEQIHGKNPEANSALFKSISGKVNFIKGNICNRKEIQKAVGGQDAIVHLAAETGTGQSMYEIEKYANVNISGTALLLDVLVNHKNSVKKFILASSRAVYGEGKYINSKSEIVYPENRNWDEMRQKNFQMTDQNDEILEAVATDEESKLHPTSFYGITKLQQEQMVKLVCSSIGIDFVILRYQNVFGVGQSLLNPYTGILSVFSTQILNGKNINVFEDGLPTRDFINVDDTVEATVRSLEMASANNETINIGTGIATTILTVAGLLSQNYQKNTEINISGDFRIGDIRHNFADLSKMKKLLGFEPRKTFAQGIAEFTEWVLNQPVQESNFERSMQELKSKGFLKS